MVYIIVVFGIDDHRWQHAIYGLSTEAGKQGAGVDFTFLRQPAEFLTTGGAVE